MNGLEYVCPVTHDCVEQVLLSAAVLAQHPMKHINPRAQDECRGETLCQTTNCTSLCNIVM